MGLIVQLSKAKIQPFVLFQLLISTAPPLLFFSCIFEPEGNACSLTDSTAEEHVLALVEHAADEARDRINRYLPNSKVYCTWQFAVPICA